MPEDADAVLVANEWPFGAQSCASAVVNPDRPPRARALSEFLYEIVDASSIIDTKALASFYPSIPVDPYIDEGYRPKAISWLRVKHRHGAVNAANDEHIARAARSAK